MTQPNKILLESLRALEWLLGPWEMKILEQALLGIWDYKRQKKIFGFLDGHCHLCRAFTFDQMFVPTNFNINELSDLPLAAKQDLIGYLHDGPAYKEDSLRERMSRQIERAIACGTREIWAVADTTPDIGDLAFKILLELKSLYAEKIDIKAGCYPVFGFKDSQGERRELIRLLMPKADFVVGLPEKDEEPDKIGFKRHVAILLDYAFSFKKEVHIHVDQTNSAHSKDSFRVIECVEALTPERFSWFTGQGERPKIWLIHVISPTAYDPEEFNCLVKKILELNIGVIVCPRAALSMRALRSEKTWTHNSIARVPEMLQAGVKMAFGTDNINDIFVPSGKGTIISELDILWDAIRCYSSHILLKVAMGIELSNGDRAMLKRGLYEYKKACLNHAEKIGKINKTIIDF